MSNEAAKFQITASYFLTDISNPILSVKKDSDWRAIGSGPEVIYSELRRYSSLKNKNLLTYGPENRDSCQKIQLVKRMLQSSVDVVLTDSPE